MHLKRINIPKSWPLAKKEKKYAIKGVGAAQSKLSVPLLILLRDILKEVNTANEAKKILNEGLVNVNGNEIKDKKFNIGLFDRIYIKKLDKAYTLNLTKNGISAKEISKDRISTKPCKIIGKKILKENKLQLNLYGGFNIITDKKINTNDTVIIDLKNKKIVDYIKLAKGNYAFVTGGNNIGEYGRIENVDKFITLNIKNKKTNVDKKNVFVIEENETK